MSLRDIYENGFDEESGKSISADSCPECSNELVSDGGEIHCRGCGLIVEERRLDHGPEWTTGDGDDSDPSRVGAPLTQTRHDRGLSSKIGYGGDANGNNLSARKRSQISRLRRQNRRGRWRTKAERNLAHACGEITRLTGRLELPDIVCEEACRIYRQAQKADLIPGRSIETMAAGSVYAACRCRGHPRTPAEIAEVARCSEEKVTLGYGVLNVELDLQTQIVTPRDHVPKLAAACRVTDRVRRRAIELAGIAEETGLANGRNPAGVAAGCLYLAGRELDAGHTQAEIGDHADVTPVTIRERYRELRDVVNG